MEHEKTPCPSPTCPICIRTKIEAKKLTLKERIQKQRENNYNASDRAWEHVKQRVANGNFEQVPVVNMSVNRKQSILYDAKAIFEIQDNPQADAKAPLIEFDFFDEVDINVDVIDSVSREVGIDASLLKAIIYMESTHGWYDRANLYLANALKGVGVIFVPISLPTTISMFIISDFIPNSKSYRPMNLFYKEWALLCEAYGISESDLLDDPYKNIKLGAILLKRIIDRIKNPSVEKIASIYNFMGAEKVTDYGARVGVIYRERLWEENDISKYIDVRGGYE
ncbi:hypothetical protein [Photobacterium damselae]|uniref:hypothetical protein n=1 Tax=Photobacterium damselae TaxID=38293 RepID=UPI000E0FC271|nr:hypothetical protein [Photobacterium damselae]